MTSTLSFGSLIPVALASDSSHDEPADSNGMKPPCDMEGQDRNGSQAYRGIGHLGA
jgi:hypothetical protein